MELQHLIRPSACHVMSDLAFNDNVPLSLNRNKKALKNTIAFLDECIQIKERESGTLPLYGSLLGDLDIESRKIAAREISLKFSHLDGFIIENMTPFAYQSTVKLDSRNFKIQSRIKDKEEENNIRRDVDTKRVSQTIKSVNSENGDYFTSDQKLFKKIQKRDGRGDLFCLAEEFTDISNTENLKFSKQQEENGTGYISQDTNHSHGGQALLNGSNDDRTDRFASFLRASIV
ncbi:unnamed protein product [Gordionus sp. m RMFG-2023]